MHRTYMGGTTPARQCEIHLSDNGNKIKEWKAQREMRKKLFFENDGWNCNLPVSIRSGIT